MVFLDIKNDQRASKLIKKLNHHLGKKNSATFILFYMEGCGPCNATRPEWHKLKNVVPDHPDMSIVSIDHTLSKKVKDVEEPSSFPTIRFMKGGKSETYEDSPVPDTKDRSIDSFVEWIKSKISLSNYKKQTNDKNEQNIRKQNGGRTQRRRKWSRAYKRSINCRRPKGFSQTQYCKYSRRRK